MAPDKGKQPAAASPPSPHPSLTIPPLFSSHLHHHRRTSLDLPHLVDKGTDEPSVPDYEHDDIFWNGVLEGGSGGNVPEYDDLGRVQGTGRPYSVRELGLPRDQGVGDGATTMQDFGLEESAKGSEDIHKEQHGGPAEFDFGFDKERSVSPTSSTFSNWDLYKPPTPPWPRRDGGRG
ncbi:hypothetical protein PMIN03_010215 [Paraphaeosphaeria minitans]